LSDAQTTNLTYDAENRLVEVKLGSSTIAAFTYDGDGNRVKGVVDSITTVYIGNYFEWTGSTSTIKKYYYAQVGKDWPCAPAAARSTGCWATICPPRGCSAALREVRHP
jgi:YD repeat-containing protein